MKDLWILLDVTRTHLLSRFKQTAIATLGVTFGIGTFIIMVSFMTGLNGLLDGLVLNRTPHIQIYNEIKPSERQPVDLYGGFADNLNVVRSVKPRQTQERIHNGMAILDYLKEHELVRGATSQVGARVFYLAGSIQLNGLVNGVDVTEEMRLFNFGDYIVRGSPEDLIRTRNGILLGAGVAGNMSVDVGDRIQVSTADGGLFPLKVVGIFQSGLAEVDNIQSYVSLSTAQQLLGQGGDYVSNIHVKLYDIEKAVAMSRRLSDQFDVTALDIQTANAQFETGTAIRNLITYAVSITLLIVAGFGIYNILNMLIYEKMNDIAILKAVGFTGRDINIIFISQAVIIGLVGGVIGLVIGFGASVLIDHTPFVTEALPTVTTYPVNFDPAYYVIGIVFAMVSTFFAGFLPSRRARKIDPVEIIRGQ